ncbi:hypothetical protein [Geodermatophilus sp. SYSU D00710]
MTDWLSVALHEDRSAELRRAVLHHRRVAAARRRAHARELARRAAALAERSAVLAARAALLSTGPHAVADPPARERVAAR